MNSDASSTSSSRTRRADIARKRAELASIREERSIAELDAPEAEDEAASQCSRGSNSTTEQRTDRLRRAGLSADGRAKDETNYQEATTTAEVPYGTARCWTGRVSADARSSHDLHMYHQSFDGSAAGLQTSGPWLLSPPAVPGMTTQAPLPHFGPDADRAADAADAQMPEQVPVGRKSLFLSAFNAVKGLSGFVPRGAASMFGGSNRA